MIRKGIAAMLCLSILIPVLSGCSEQTVTPTTEPEKKLPTFYYDDRLTGADLGGTAQSQIQIVQQQVTSKKVGSDQADDAVLFYDEASSQWIATGVGTATVTVDGKSVDLVVVPAPISLFMITGHSIGAGQCGNGAQSILCEAGQAYSCHRTSTFKEATADMGIGFSSTVKPTGIDAFAPNGGGTIGEGSAIAYKWNQLTDEKVWILNAAVGGSVITEWYQGQKYYIPAVAMYRAAAQVLANEVAAGHYVLKNTGIFYHSGANFSHKNVVFTEETLRQWYDSMLTGFQADLSFDITGDGQPETVEAVGFVPYSFTATTNDIPLNFALALSDEYPQCFMAGKTISSWKSEDMLKANFPAIDYKTQSEPVQVPTTVAEMYAEDNVHHTQVVYNAEGLELGENLYNHFRTDVKAQKLMVVTKDGGAIRDTVRIKHVGESITLIISANPCYFSNVTITHSDNVELSTPMTVTGKAAGEGFIAFSKDGQELLRLKVVISQ